MGYKIGADVGGTFTDFLVVDEYELICDKYNSYLMYPQGKSL